MTPELLDKLEHARRILRVNGYLTTAENDKVKKRVLKSCKKAKLDIVERNVFNNVTKRFDHQ